ncbi:uncharacterized protein TM35_000017340 [Trypanosoma theileri]|uniref:B30.2/SPRY domain-containing protein n=1 Tax=Trypanosoma theileri TaxID=67003 RepID=A0A1X0PA93_9TRYP|nr:uncharacterized protein TM35_000017340 [Trypanosoma theileri]ORC93857.1 hypothetical protein TM35_000017340 [Trypanosoma theileri]
MEPISVLQEASHAQTTIANGNSSRNVTSTVVEPPQSLMIPEEQLRETTTADDDDYSTDSSVGGQPQQHQQEQQQQQQQGGGEGRVSGRRRRPPRAFSGRENIEGITTGRSTTLPEVYRYSTTAPQKTIWNHSNGLYPSEYVRVGTESITSLSLEDLVKYSSIDLLSRAWPLVPSAAKVLAYAPFPQLPDLPEVVNVRYLDTDQVARFMRLTAVEFAKRQTFPTPVFLRSLLVTAAANAEAKRVEQASLSVHLYSEDSLCSNWEDECTDSDDLDSDENFSHHGTVIPSTDVNHVDSLDWTMAFISESLESQIPRRVIKLLHCVVDRCGINSSSATLHSWGVQRLTRMLLIQTERETASPRYADSSEWLAAATALLFKMVLASRRLDTLLSALRWVYRHRRPADSLRLQGTAAWVTALETAVRPRVRLPFPASWSKAYDVPLAHSLGADFAHRILGVAVAAHEEEEAQGIIITKNGIYKIMLKPPYTVLEKNEDAHVTDCCGVFLEDNRIVIQSVRAKVISCFDLETLQVCNSPDADEIKSKEDKFQVYIGMGKFVLPHFYYDKYSPRYARFEASLMVKGTLEPKTIFIPPITEALSVQFFLCTQPTQQSTSLQLVHLEVFGKVWLSVKIRLDARNSSLFIRFEHSDDVIAEVQQPIQDSWTLWSANLVPSNDLAIWKIYKDGVLLDSSGNEGLMFKPTVGAGAAPTAASISFLEGTFNGYISGLQIWNKYQSVSEFVAAATGKNSDTDQSGLMCSFKMNEGSGCCFQSENMSHIWKGTTPLWCAPQTTTQEKYVRESELIPYIPSGDYYVLTNEYETVMVENGFCTWINTEGRILEQQFMNVKPSELYFLCTYTNRIYSVISDKSGFLNLRWIQALSTPTRYVRSLTSVKNSTLVCTKVLNLVKDKQQLTPVLLSQFILHRLNIALLSGLTSSTNAQYVAHIFLWNRSSPQTLSRLVDMCNDLITLVISSKCEDDFTLLLLCVCGRMLTRQMSWIGRGCPAKLVPTVVNMYERLHEFSCENGGFLSEAQNVFSQLHRVFLVECVSHDYQLQRIMEAKKLTDVKDLLVPEYLPSLVSSVIEKDLKKPFMTFLNRLKEECLLESESVLNGKSTPFKPSYVTLATLLGILSQKKNPQWHLVSVALMCSLCKGILRLFNSTFPITQQSGKGRTLEQLDMLRQTSIGIVVFPIAHFLSYLEIDSTVAVDILSMLNKTRESLVSYAPALSTPPVTHCFTETHRVVIPAAATCPHTTVLDLRHAKSIELVQESLKTDETPSVQISLLTNEYKRLVETLSNSTLHFDNGGKLEIACMPTTKNREIIITVNAQVELRTESTHWIRDTCFALSHTILRITHQLLLTDPPNTIILPRESLFRGGLSQETLKEHHIITGVEESHLDRTDQNELIQLCEETGTLFNDWLSMYGKKRIPYQERLEPILRKFCAAHVWHSHRPKNISLQKLLEDSLEYMRKKTFLILEALQQGNETQMLQRAEFLLKMVNPRARIEFLIAEQQQTEEPITRVTPSTSTRLMMPNIRSVTGVTSYSLDKTGSQSVSFMRRLATSVSEFSNIQYGGMGSILRPRNSLLGAGAVSEGIQSTPETVSSQVLSFLLRGYDGISNDELIAALVKKAQQATIHTAAYRLQEELCVAHQSDEDMTWLLVSSHLLYRELAYLQHGGSLNSNNEENVRNLSNDNGISRSDSIVHHYIETMIGCGFHRELELQKASCSFLHSIIQQSLLSRSESDKYNESKNDVGALSLCAILCHPWDSVDMSIIRPAKIFRLLKKYIFLSIDDTLPSTSGNSFESDIWYRFVRECGIFSLMHRGVIIPNTLQPAAERINIVEGDTLGVHIEDADACCLARNHWRALRMETTINQTSVDHDCFAGTLSGYIPTDMIDALYFEVTLELLLNEQAIVSIGLASSPISTATLAGKENSVVFCSDGTVKFGNAPIRFGTPWCVGDVIGCGVMAPFNDVFFTRNGEFLGIATRCSFAIMIPLIAVQAMSSLVKLIVNFGENTPFKFDIASLHSSCRTRLTSPVMLSDSAFITAQYLVTLCFKNLQLHEKSESTVNEDSVCGLLEEAAVFLREIVLELVRRIKHMNSDTTSTSSEVSRRLRNGNDLLARLFRTVGVVIDCFRFNAVTSVTHLEILRLCSVTLIDAHDRWAKVRAARCLGNAARALRLDYFGEAVQGLRRFVTPEVVVNGLAELARAKLFREREAPVFVPRWAGGGSTVAGKGAFYGAAPLPATGTHRVGFRIRRRQQEGRGVGAPLGGCYYIGLTHGHPEVTNMQNLISRNDVYVLQDTDDQDQVPHLLLRRHCIPRSSQRRIYGNDETIWVELNADLGEISYYRDKMVPIGLAFANLPRVDDLYPFVFHFNEDASCELIQAPTQADDPCETLVSHFRRSVAIHTLQQLHVVPYFGNAVSQWIYRFLPRSQQYMDNCLIALAILGGEKSHEYSQHETHGAVVVDSISDITLKALVYLEADSDMRLFPTKFSEIKPSFVRPPLFSLCESESLKCSSWLVSELCRSLFEASVILPLINSEEERRREIEGGFFNVTTNAINLNYVSLFNSIPVIGNELKYSISSTTPDMPMLQSTSMSFKIVNGEQTPSGTPVTIDRRFSSISIFSPSPSIGVTQGNGYSVLCGNLLVESVFSFAVSITTTASANNLLYVGVSSETNLPTEPEKVASCKKIWALCNHDTDQTNSVNCSVGPRMIFSAEHILFGSGDIVIVRVNQHEGTVFFSRIRGGNRVDFGILFESIPKREKLRPFVLACPDSVVIFSFLNTLTFPARNTFPRSSISLWKGSSEPLLCSSCGVELSVFWYEGEGGLLLCVECFNSWQHPKVMFHLARAEDPLPDYLVSQYSPKELLVGTVVEFVESSVFAWSSEKSVNVDIEGCFCIAKENTGFATLEPLSVYGDQQIDICLSHIAGVDGFPFSGLQSFIPLWRVGGVSKSSCTLNVDTLLVSSTVIPHGTKVMVELQIIRTDEGESAKGCGLFVGVTNLSGGKQVINTSELERRIANNKIWGTWCDGRVGMSSSFTVYLFVDLTRGRVMMSSTLMGLHAHPVMITCGCPFGEDVRLRVAVFARETCRISSGGGFVSRDDLAPAPAPVAIALMPDAAVGPPHDLAAAPVFLFDTAAQTRAHSAAAWRLAPRVEWEDNGVLFAIGDTLTIAREENLLVVYRNGLHIATHTLPVESVLTPQRLVVYLSTRGMIATVVAPLYGKSHLGKVIQTTGTGVGIVECMCQCQGKRRYAVRKKDVRYCALAANSTEIETGARVIFKAGSPHEPKRGIVTSIENNTINVRDEEEKRMWFSVHLGSLYLLDNEDTNEVVQLQYPFMTPPSSAVTRIFEVGKTKYRVQCNGSYNGIMFDLQAHEAVILTGLSVMTHTTGRHRVDVFFKKGTHNMHERESTAWTKIFSNLVEMHSGRQFSITFPEIHVDPNTTFALYINATHNCGVGHYSKEDGCTGAISSKMDYDGTLTVYVGRTSESSTPFLETNNIPRGFCGSIMYMQTKDTRPSLMDKTSLNFSRTQGSNETHKDVIILKGQPSAMSLSPSANFVVEVFEGSIVIEKLILPIFFDVNVRHSMGMTQLRVSLFYTSNDDSVWETHTEHQWIWAYYTVLPFMGDAHELCLDGLNIGLKRGSYIFNAFCVMGVGQTLEEEEKEKKEEKFASLTCFLKSTEDGYKVQNKFFSVRDFTGIIYAAAANDIIMSEKQSAISTGSHLNQNNSASYNGIMFDLRSKRDILLEEVFCVAQTTTDNVNVKIYWKEGTMEGAEKTPSQWQQVIAKDLYLVDKQSFSPGLLNLHLRANQVYAIYINTSSSCGVRFYNSSDGHVGDVGDEFEDDGVLTIFVGKKSESPIPFAEVPAEPRALRGRITYRPFLLKPSQSRNQAVFSVLKGFVVTRILAALIAYVSGTSTGTTLFEEKSVIEALAIFATSKTNTLCDAETAGNLLSSSMRGIPIEDLRDSIVTLPLAGNEQINFNAYSQGDLALVANVNEMELSRKLVRLISNPDEKCSVLLKEEGNPNNSYTLSLDSLLPIIECPDCHLPFASQSICEKTGKIHLPTSSEEDRLIIILSRYFSNRWNINKERSMACAKLILNNAASHNISFDVLHKVNNTENCITSVQNHHTTEYTISPEYFFEGGSSNTTFGFICPFVYHETMGAFNSISFTSSTGAWKVMFLSDLPFRIADNSPLKVFIISFGVILQDGTRENLLSYPVLFYGIKGGPIHLELPSFATSLHFSCFPYNGYVHLYLDVQEKLLPSPTPMISSPVQVWMWENGSDIMELHPNEVCKLMGKFDFVNWTKGKPRFCQLSLTSKSKNNVFFLELQIIIPKPMNIKLWEGSRNQVIHRGFNISRDEEVTIAFTVDGDFIIYDKDDNIRSHIVFDSTLLSMVNGSLATVAIMNAGSHSLLLRLSHPSSTKRNDLVSRYTNCTTEPNSYTPSWVLYDSDKVSISENGLTASCNGESGQAVIGSPLPINGLSSFILQIDRSDRESGDSLGSGHFAGIALSTFSQLAPHFEMLRRQVDSVWAVQDVYDNDSLPTQEPLSPLNNSSGSLFVAGTKLCFILNREDGTLSLARDNEPPRVVFRNIPPNMPLSPFVRLDHANASATLSPFSCSTLSGEGELTSPSTMLSSLPITPSILRRFPFRVVVSIFHIFRRVINSLPSHQVALIEKSWNDCFNSTRMAYRLSNAVQSLVEIGAFSRRMVYAKEDEIEKFFYKSSVQKIVQSLSEYPEKPVLVISDLNEKDEIVMILPDDYEIIGRVKDSSMIRLLYFNENGPNEYTLHLFNLEESNIFINKCNIVAKHPCVMYQEDIIRTLNETSSYCGVITHGWYDCTLKSVYLSKFSEWQQQVIAMSLIGALEHWHLHYFSHGHIKPENVYLRMDGSDILSCTLWNIYYLKRDDCYASNELKSKGIRDMKSDRWSCARIIKDFSSLLSANIKFVNLVDLMMNTDMSISEIILQTGAFSEVSQQTLDGPQQCLRTGAHLHSGTGSYNGIMFDLVAKQVRVKITKVTFVPDTTATSRVTLFVHDGTFIGVENEKSAWQIVLQREMQLSHKVEVELSDFEPIIIPAGDRVALYLHTTSGSGVLFYSESDGVKADMAEVEEENDFLGITVGKKSENVLPFVGIQNQKRLIKGSITYVLPSERSEYRSQITKGDSDEVVNYVKKNIGEPVIVENSRPGLVLDFHENDYLIFLDGGRCEWIPSDHVKETNMDESPVWCNLEDSLQNILWNRQKKLLINSNQYPYNRELIFQKIGTNGVKFLGTSSLPEQTWWISDLITTSCVVSVWQTNAHINTSLYLVISLDEFSINHLDMTEILNHGHAFLSIDEWERSVILSSEDNGSLIKKLPDDLSKVKLRLAFGPVDDDMEDIPINAFITCRSDVLDIRTVTDSTALVFIQRNASLQGTFVLNGVTIKCSMQAGKIPTFSSTPSVAWHSTISINLVSLDTNRPKMFERMLTTTSETLSEEESVVVKSKEISPYLVEIKSGQTWIEEEVILFSLSHSLEVSKGFVQQISHGKRLFCNVQRPIFEGSKAHEVEILIVASKFNPIQLAFIHPSKNWCSEIPLPVFCSNENIFMSPSASVQNIRVSLRIFPWAKRAFASVDGGVMYEVLPALDCPSEFQLRFSFSGPGSYIRILSWRVCEHIELSLSRDALLTIWSQFNINDISPNVSHSVGILTRHSRSAMVAHSSRNADFGIVSQIESVMVSYARQLLGTVILAAKLSKTQKILRSLLPFTPLCNDLLGLENLVYTEIRRNSFVLLAEAYACLATPKIVQTVEKVEASINIIFVSLKNDNILQILSSSYGTTLILLLFHTATIYSRSIRHMALRCALILIKNPHCALPSHETLTASFAPLLRMMNGLCRRGKMSSTVIQLGVSLICEMISRYQLERPTLVAPGRVSAVPYAIVTCTKVAVSVITANPPLPLPEALAEEPQGGHCIKYEIRTSTPSPQGFKSSYGVFSETFRSTFGTKKFEVVLNNTRSGNVVVGWDMDATLPGSISEQPLIEGSARTLLPSCGYFIDTSGKVFICLSHKKESQPLKVRARGGDVIVVKCLYHEQAIIINLRRGVRNETTTRFETYPNEMLALPVFFTEKMEDATFNGDTLSDVSPGIDVAQLYNKLQEFPNRVDTDVVPQSYEFYAELALFCQTVINSKDSLASLETEVPESVHSHDLASFPLLSAFLGVSAFSNEVPLFPLLPYLKRLRIFDVLTSVFSVVVDLRRKTELFDLWKKLKNLCSLKSSEKIQNETMKPFRFRSGSKANVIIHTMQARPSVRLGPYPTLMRSVFGQLFVQLQRSPISIFYASPMFTVKLAGFGSTDAGGPYRDVLSQLATEIMTTHPNGTFQLNPLFAPCGRGGQSAVMPNVVVALSSQSSLMFEFFGRLLAACFVTKDLLAVEFPPLFWKLLLSEDVSSRDLTSIDFDILRQLTPEELMDRTAEELEERFPGIQESWMTFCAENPNASLDSELPPSNTHCANILSEQIALLELHKYDIAMNYIKHGFDEVIPLYTLNAFRWQQVELMVCGTPKLSYDALRKVCQISLPPNDTQMFLGVIESMTEEDRMLLLRFTTGQTRLPIKEPIKVQRSGVQDSLPTSSTCFFTLRLPFYSSPESMKERILYAIRQCKAIDTDGQAREHIILDT